MVALLHPVYMLLNEWTSGLPATDLALDIDHATPLVPEWIVIYVLLYPVASMPGFVVRYRPLLIRTAMAYVLVELIAFGWFVAMPVHMVIRPDAVVVDSFYTWGLQLCYTLDPPSNCFPSLHVATSFLGAMIVHKIAPRMGRVLLVLATLIAISTMLVKQHYLADVISGLALGLGVYGLVIRPYNTADLPPDSVCFPRWITAAWATINGLVLLGIYLLYRGGWQPW